MATIRSIEKEKQNIIKNFKPSEMDSYITALTTVLYESFLKKDFNKCSSIKKLIEEGLIEITENDYVISPETNFYSKETGVIYDVNNNVRDTDLKNGSRVILV